MDYIDLIKTLFVFFGIAVFSAWVFLGHLRRLNTFGFYYNKPYNGMGT